MDCAHSDGEVQSALYAYLGDLDLAAFQRALQRIGSAWRSSPANASLVGYLAELRARRVITRSEHEFLDGLAFHQDPTLVRRCHAAALHLRSQLALECCG